MDFKKYFDNFFGEEVKKRKIGIYYPSDSGVCLRRLWYSYMSPTIYQADSLKLFKLGDFIHNLVKEVVKSERNPNISLISFEFPVEKKIDDFKIAGRGDLLIENSEGIFLVEIKSVDDLKKISKPLEHHLSQLNLYMHISGVHKGILLYVDRRNLDALDFHVNYNEDLASKEIERFRKLHFCLKNDCLPDPEFGKYCSFCNFRDKCSKNEK